MTKAKKALAKPITFSALSPTFDDDDALFSPDEIMDSIGKQSVRNLEKIKVPSGGSIVWEVIGEDGEPDVVKTLEAVIVETQDTRQWYAKKYSGGNEPPDCVSIDMINGVPGDDCPPEITGNCQTCPKNQWGSAVDDEGNPTNGKACQERKLVLMYREDDMVPLLLSIPPTSLTVFEKDMGRIAVAKRRPIWAMVWKFSLTKEKNARNIEYSQVKAEFVRNLKEEEVLAMRELRKQFVPEMESAFSGNGADSE